jgi:hypothetical protein
VSKILKTMGTQMPAIKKRKRKKKDSSFSLAKVSKFQIRDMFQGA